jgi:hypothetical protein
MQVDLPSTDELIASVAQFLIDGHEEDAASILLSCEAEMVEGLLDMEIFMRPCLSLRLTCPREAYDMLIGQGGNEIAYSLMRRSIENAVSAVLPFESPVFTGLQVRAGLVSVASNWRAELLDIARGKGVHNQAVEDFERRIVKWNNLRFRTAAEVRIAAALETIGVLFLPNCKVRLGLGSNRQNREADFLICHEGRWGILEVDGEPFHPPSCKAQEDERDRLFKHHGILVVEHFDATQCFEAPHDVVKRFLAILRQR